MPGTRNSKLKHTHTHNIMQQHRNRRSSSFGKQEDQYHNQGTGRKVCHSNVLLYWNIVGHWRKRDEGSHLGLLHVRNFKRHEKVGDDRGFYVSDRKSGDLRKSKDTHGRTPVGHIHGIETSTNTSMTSDSNVGMLRETLPDAVMAPRTRTTTITIHGVANDMEPQRLSTQLEGLNGVKKALISSYMEGGMRGGFVTAQLEIEKGISLKEIIRSIQDMNNELIVLPLKFNSWIWRGHKINFGVAGCGKPIILVHGFGGNAGHFGNLITYLADHYRVYAVDLLGFGASDKPPEMNYGPDLWAEQICDFAKEFAEEGAVLIGNSIGSLTALAAAAAGSNTFRGLVLLNCAGAMNRKGLMQDDLLLQVLSPIFVAVEYLLQKPRIASALFNRFRSKGNIRKILEEQAYRNKEAVTDQLVDILYQPSTDQGALNVFVKVFTGDPGPRPEMLMPQINSPVLVLWGDNDPWTPINGPVGKYFTKLSRERGDVQIFGLPDVGHCPHDDRPELAAEYIFPFLANLDW
ncbi:hypothetical protein O6H91_13G026600 [Diphasiastrum complanatum]|uniref:Uncharacterized protein n=1 Tax=Diphasiastrum complanatum TaxID=34168 RepID=A0ACC2BT60_DIPCM|nr:hypothetical protein O6H91_13G026600 [Diphasiastrum complanatum]